MNNPAPILRGVVAWGRLAGECFTRCVRCDAVLVGASRRRFCTNECRLGASMNVLPCPLERCRCQNCGKRFFSRGGPTACDWRCIPGSGYSRECAECGQPFDAEHHRRKTCSDECHQAAYDRMVLKQQYPWADKRTIDMCILRRRYSRTIRRDHVGRDEYGNSHRYQRIGPNRYVVPGRGVITRQRISQLRASGEIQ